MAASVLAYTHAWDVMRMMVNQQMVSQPMPYLLVAATSTTNGIQSAPGSDTSKPNGATSPPAVAVNARPVTRKDPVPKAVSANAPAPVKQTSSQPVNPGTAVAGTQQLEYGDGSTVDGQNLTEVQTFQRYLTEKKAAPESKVALLDYYRERVQASSVST